MGAVKNNTKLDKEPQIQYSIRIENLTKNYGKIKVLDNLSMNLNHNESLGIIGPNGTGKTTLFRCLMGLVRIHSGNISILGQKTVKKGKILPQLRDLRPRIGFVPEYLEIYPFLTITEFLNFLGNLFGLSDEERSIYIDYLIDIYELENWQKTLIKNLSKGNLQKIMLCTALIHQPEVLILDEPFTSLDVNVRKKTKNLLKQFVTKGIPELGINSPGSILICSHILPVLEDLCANIAILHSGKIIWDGAISDVKKSTQEKILWSEGEMMISSDNRFFNHKFKLLV